MATRPEYHVTSGLRPQPPDVKVITSLFRAPVDGRGDNGVRRCWADSGYPGVTSRLAHVDRAQGTGARGTAGTAACQG